MKGDVFIDNKDIFQSFGATITGGLESLFVFPAIKAPEANDWPEQDGIEVDLDDINLSAKEVTLTFLADSYPDFMEFITQPGYRTIRVTKLGREWKLRYSSQSSNKWYKESSAFSLRFIEDDPVRPVDDTIPLSPGVWIKDNGDKIDDVNFSAYGVEMYDSLSNLLQSPQLKQNLTRDISIIDGQIYNTGLAVTASKDLTVKCLMIASDIERFWKCYDSFFGDIIQPGERELSIAESGAVYPAYYNKSSNFNVRSLDSPVIVEFNLSFVITSMRLRAKRFILATEDGRIIVLENGITMINMKPYA